LIGTYDGIDYLIDMRIVIYLCKEELATTCDFIEKEKEEGGWTTSCKDTYFVTSDYKCVSNDKEKLFEN